MERQEHNSDALQQQQQQQQRLWMQSLFAGGNQTNANDGNRNYMTFSQTNNKHKDVTAAPSHPSNSFGNSTSVAVPAHGNSTRFNSQELPGMGVSGGQLKPQAWLGAGVTNGAQVPVAMQHSGQPTLFQQLQHQFQANQNQNRVQQNPAQQQQQQPQFQQAAQLAALQSLLQTIAGGTQQQPQAPASISNAILQQLQGVQGINVGNGNQGNFDQQQMCQPTTNLHMNSSTSHPESSNSSKARIADVGGRNSASSSQQVTLWNNNALVHPNAPPSSDKTARVARNAASNEEFKNEGATLSKQPITQTSFPSGSPPATRSAPSRSVTDSASQDQERVRVSNSGPILVPCRSRTAPPGHNIKTGYLLIPDDASHGMDLLCSHNQCRNEGVKFLYCAVCQLPVAKRNFRKRHSHLDVLLNQVTTSSHPQLQVKSSSSKFAQGIVVPPKHKAKTTTTQIRVKDKSAPIAPRDQKKILNSTSKKKLEKGQGKKTVRNDEVVTKNSSSGSGKPKEYQTKGSTAPTHVSKSTPNGHSVSFSGSCSEPPSSLSNGDSNSNNSDLTTQATTAGMKPPSALKNGNMDKQKSKDKRTVPSSKNKASKTMAEALDTYNKTNNSKNGSKRKSSKKLDTSSNKQLRNEHAPVRKEETDKRTTDAPNGVSKENDFVGTATKVSNESSATPPFTDSKGNSSEKFKNSGAEELKNMRRLLLTGNEATAATESSGAAVARQNQAAAEQAINVDAATTRMWEALLHERPSSNSVNDFRRWLLRCLSVSARFEGNRQHLSDSINAKAANRDNSVHSCSARCSSVSSLSSETLQDKGSIASSSDVAVMIRDGVNMAERSVDENDPLRPKCEKSRPPKKRFPQEPHILELPDDFHIDTPVPSGTDGGSGSNSSKIENKANDTAAVVEPYSGGVLEPQSNLVPMVEERRRKKHSKKRKRKHAEEKDSKSGRSNRSKIMLEDVTQAVGV